MYMQKEIKTQIRRGVFETNSSSTHSISLVTEDYWEKWQKGKVLYCDYEDSFKTIEELEEMLKISIEEYNEQKRKFIEEEGWLDNDFWMTFDEYYDNVIRDSYETFEEHKHGVVAFGYYGYDY